MFARQLIAVSLFFSICGVSVNLSAAEILSGKWTANNNSAHFEFYKHDQLYSARLIWLSDSLDKNGNKKKDIRNPDISLRNRELVGIDIITDLKSCGDKWIDGKIYSPNKGITASLTVEMRDKNTILLFVSKGPIKITKKWQRIE